MFNFSLVICAVMQFYGYNGPEDRDWSHPRWYRLNLPLPGFKNMTLMCGKSWTDKLTIKTIKHL